MASKLAGVFAVLLLSYSLSAQQFHGPGASLTTSTPNADGGFGMRGSFGGRGFSTPGIPPSLTSITPSPNHFNSGFLPRGFRPGDGGGRRHGRHGFGQNFVPFFVPTYSYYPYYPYADSGLYPDTDQGTQMDYAQPEDTRPALTVFENRPGYRPPPAGSADSGDYAGPRESDDRGRASAQPEAPPTPAVDQAPTVLVFRDGHKLEVGNYAIQGDLLYNLDGNGPRKIKLGDLDLDKTVQANDERGNEFRLPKKYRG
jgi:hypothetical protein